MNTILQFAHASAVDTHAPVTTPPALDQETVVAAMAATFLLALVVGLISYIITGVFLGKLFKKAGIASWVAWVPIYNNWKMLEIGGQQGYWAALALLPVVQYGSVAFMYIAMYNIGHKFGKSNNFVLLGVFLPIVWIIWLALDTSKWKNSLGEPSVAIEHLAKTSSKK